MAYRTILTSYGLTRLAAATASGTPINLTHMAVGDGNGNPVTPTESQTQLVGERYRAPLNRVYQDPAQATKFITELVIPADIGGFVVREAGVFDDAGGLFAVANTPSTYKPTPSEGAFSDAVVRMAFLATNANVVTLQVDPNVAVATHQWVINNITPALLFPGGTTGQVLTKNSNADGDASWQDPDTAAVVVDVIEEPQELAEGQTTVTWAIVTTRGLAVYIEGVRIEKGPGPHQWMEDPAQPDTRIILGTTYPAGSRILGTQNEPTGSVPFPLIRDQNLEDVPSKSTARANLGVHSIEESNAAGQPGDVKYTARNTAPPGWLKANGAAVSRTTYAALFAAIGTTYGAGDGFNTFNLPDLRGEFIRGWDDGRGVDSGRAMGSGQGHAVQSHSHSVTVHAAGAHNHTTTVPVDNSSQRTRIDPETSQPFWARTASTGNFGSSTNGEHTHSATAGSTGGVETRPRNVALLACIKF